MAVEAVQIIDDAIAQGQGGEEIVQALEGAGIALDYSQMEGGPEALAEEGMEEMPPEGMEEVGGDPGAEGAPFEPQPGGPEGGMRDLRISAVRFALNKAKEEEDEQEEPVV
jgi:hypothetical protein